MYGVRILDAASRELSQLDKTVGRRIIERINWLSVNLNDIDLEALTGDLAGFFKFRVGDYRVLYQVLHSEQLILIHSIGHRRDVYRKRKG